MDIYNFTNYIEYLSSLSDDPDKGGRGFKSKLSRAISSNTSYVSHIFSGRQNLTEDQGFALSKYLELSKAQTEYLLLLIQKERAGSARLKKFKLNQIHQIQNERKELASRYKSSTKNVSRAVQEKYYSSWVYAAVHVLTSIEGFSNSKLISQRLNIPISLTENILSFLVSAKLCKIDNKGLVKYASGNLHIKKASVFSIYHNHNWKRKASENIDLNSPADFHYSSVISFSKDRADLIREILITAIDKIRNEVSAPAKDEEDLYCYALDYFKV